MSDWILATVWVVAFGLITAGVHTFSHGLALIVGGVLLAVWGWLIVEVDE